MNIETAEFAKKSIQKGSKSFALASMFFDQSTRQDVWQLYSWCRFIDDIADGDLDTITKKNILQVIKKRIIDLQLGAIQSEQSLIEILEHPAQKAFEFIVQKYDLNTQYALDLIRGMEWDLEFRPIRDQDDLEDYCYCVAGTVGLMMCSLMGVKNQAAYPFAEAMGKAMQLTNICRDLIEDKNRQRCYLPIELVRQSFHLQLSDEKIYSWILSEMTDEQFYQIAKVELIRANELYDLGHRGIIYLPFRMAWAVLSARFIYQEIGVKITRLGVAAINIRVHTSQYEKIRLIFKALAVLLMQLPQRFMYLCKMDTKIVDESN